MIISASALLAGGCSSIEHCRLSQDDDKSYKGIRYYGSSMYLLLYSDGKGGLITEIHEYPDQLKLMGAAPKNIAASSETTLELTNGMLTKTVDKGDGTAIPSAVIKAVETVAAAALSALDADETAGHKLPPPHLYKIVTDQNAIRFLGGPPNNPTEIKVTLTEAGK